MLISVSDAAGRLGVSARRVRQLIEQGDLPASRLGKSWAVDKTAVERRVAGESPPGRPYSLLNSWRLAALADAMILGDEGSVEIMHPPGGTPAQVRWHAMRSLRDLLAHGDPDIVAAMIRSRSDRVEYRYVHHSLANDLASDPRLIISGGRAAESVADLLADEQVEAYVKAGDLALVDDRYGLLSVEAAKANVILRVVGNDLTWKAAAAPLLLVAADLRERDDARAREASDELFRKLQRAVRSR